MHSRVANLLGATALAVTDLTTRGATASGLSPSGAAAVVVLASSGPLSGTELGKRVGLTQSAAVRLVNSLVSAGLAERSSRAGRVVLVALTPDGRAAAESLLAAREAVLAPALSALSARQREQLTGLLEPVLAALYGQIRSSELMCRLCDRAVCVSDAVCPVGQAERDTG